MFLDPQIISWILIAFASGAAYMIGYHTGTRKTEMVISSTITYLVNDGYIKSYVDQNGDLELVKINDEVPDGSSKALDEA